MLSTDQHQKTLAHLYHIAGSIYAAMQVDEKGPFWLVPHYETPEAPNYTTKQSQQIFNGDGGIALFLMMLYQFDGDDKHLQTAKRILSRLLDSNLASIPEFFYFYSGLPDLLYLALKMFDITREEAYRRKAIELTLLHQSDIIDNTKKFDLLNGHAGNLLVLTLVYHHHPTGEILKIIHRLLDLFITNARIGQTGLKWNHKKFAFDSPTGLSHGASGIGYALIAVGTYFNYPGIIFLGEQAFQYEMQYLDESVSNWIDLRVGPSQLRLDGAHNWDMAFLLSKPSDVNAWAYGAAGIGLAHMSVFEITHNQDFLKYGPMIADRCKRDVANKKEDYTLCSGYAGMVPFLMKVEQKFPAMDLKQTVFSISENAWELYLEKGAYNTFLDCNTIDNGLFSGKAGVGFALIQMLSDGRIGDITCPRLPISLISVPNPNYSKSRVQQQVFGQYFIRTLNELQKYALQFDLQNETSTIEDFEKALGEIVLSVPSDQQTHIEALYNLERARVYLWQTHRGALCFANKKKFLTDLCPKLVAMNDEKFLEEKFVLSKYAHLHYYPEIRHSDLTLTEAPKAGTPILLMCEENNVSELYIGSLTEVILNCVHQPITGTTICEYAGSQVSHYATMRKEVNSKITHQLIDLVCSGIIEIC